MGGLDVILGPIILSEIHVLVFRSYLRLKFFKKMNIFKGRASPSLWLVHRYTRYNFKLTGPTRGTRRAVRHEGGRFKSHPSLLGFTPSSLGPTRRHFLPFAVGSYTNRRWVHRPTRCR